MIFSLIIALILFGVFVTDEDNLIKVGLLADRLGTTPQAVLTLMAFVYVMLSAPIGFLLQAMARRP